MNDTPAQFEITAHPQNAGLAREWVREAAVRAGFSGMDLADIEIAVGEAVTNAILYGSPTAGSQIVVVCGVYEKKFFVEVRDQGHGFDPNAVRQEVDHDSLGGRGIRLMRALMDEVDLHYDGDGMIARLFKNLPQKTSNQAA